MNIYILQNSNSSVLMATSDKNLLIETYNKFNVYSKDEYDNFDCFSIDIWENGKNIKTYYNNDIPNFLEMLKNIE